MRRFLCFALLSNVCLQKNAEISIEFFYSSDYSDWQWIKPDYGRYGAVARLRLGRSRMEKYGASFPPLAWVYILGKC